MIWPKRGHILKVETDHMSEICLELSEVLIPKWTHFKSKIFKLMAPYKYYRSWSTNGWSDRYWEAPFDVLERQKDDGVHCAAICNTRHVPYAIAKTSAKINRKRLQVKPINACQRSLMGRLSLWVDACFWGCCS